jgi:STE24 endopeptidase
MTLHPLTLLLVIAIGANFGVRAWLARRHLAHVQRHRDHLPDAFVGKIPLSTHRLAADYTRAKTRASLVGLALGSLVLLGWTLGGGLDALDSLWRRLELPELARGVLVITSALLVAGALDLPMSIYHTFGIEQRFGFNRTTWRLFVLDLCKQAVLGLLLVAPLAAVILWLMTAGGGAWWLHAWLVWLAFSLVLAWLYPVLLAPLFNQFKELDDAELRDRIKALLARNGLTSNRVYVMDGSKRSGHGNAYFTGLGRNKRIVFFDTLLEALTPSEIEAVLAHEVGHCRCHHVPKQIGVHAAMSFAALFALDVLMQREWFYQALGVTTPSLHAALLLFLFVSPTFFFLVQPAFTRLSRRHELAADRFAAAQTEAADLISALVKLYRDNASTLTPDPLYSAFHDTHPPILLRIEQLGRAVAR